MNAHISRLLVKAGGKNVEAQRVALTQLGFLVERSLEKTEDAIDAGFLLDESLRAVKIQKDEWSELFDQLMLLVKNDSSDRGLVVWVAAKFCTESQLETFLRIALAQQKIDEAFLKQALFAVESYGPSLHARVYTDWYLLSRKLQNPILVSMVNRIDEELGELVKQSSRASA